MDKEFEELLSVNSTQAFNFFSGSLREALDGRRFNADQMVYVASILTHYTQTSRFDTRSIPFTSELTGVFDYFVLEQPSNDPKILEIGGSHVLLFTGFFRDQMRHRHNVDWYDSVGQSLYDRASRLSKDSRKQKLFDGLAQSFPTWTRTCSKMSRTLRENRFIINPD